MERQQEAEPCNIKTRHGGASIFPRLWHGKPVAAQCKQMHGMGMGGKREKMQRREKKEDEQGRHSQHQHQRALGLETHTHTHNHTYSTHAACQRVRHRLIVLPASSQKSRDTYSRPKQARPCSKQHHHRMTNWCIASSASSPVKVTPWLQVAGFDPDPARGSQQLTACHESKRKRVSTRRFAVHWAGTCMVPPMQQSMFMFAQAAHHWLASGGESNGRWANR